MHELSRLASSMQAAYLMVTTHTQALGFLGVTAMRSWKEDAINTKAQTMPIIDHHGKPEVRLWQDDQSTSCIKTM
jgi:hypothetical protein